MIEPYEEILSGETLLRLPPGERHEAICERLRVVLEESLASVPRLRLLARRSLVELTTGTLVRPDLSVLSADGGRLWLAVEVVSSDDHRVDTVTKKSIYEDVRLPRLWMVDPRYDNVEVYQSSEYGLVLKGILAGRECLTDVELPALRVPVSTLF